MPVQHEIKEMLRLQDQNKGLAEQRMLKEVRQGAVQLELDLILVVPSQLGIFYDSKLLSRVATKQNTFTSLTTTSSIAFISAEIS